MEVTDELTITATHAPNPLPDIEALFLEQLEAVLNGMTQEGRVHCLRSILADTMGKEFLHQVDEQLKGKTPQEKVRMIKSYLIVLAFRYGEENQDDDAKNIEVSQD